MARKKRQNEPPEVLALRVACILVAAVGYLALKTAGVSLGYAVLGGVGVFLVCTAALATWERRKRS